MRIFCILCSFLIIELIRICGFTAAAFDEHETAQLRAFLVQESAEPGVMNYQQLGLTSMDDISWGEIPGLWWNQTTWLLVWLDWSRFKLSGNLEISGFLELRTLYCSYNEINAVTIYDCPSLINLDLYTNKLTEIDVSDLPALRYLRLGYNNIQIVDISNNPELRFFCCTENQVETLDFSNHEFLETVYCTGNEIHTIIADNCVKLETFACCHNALTSLSLYNLPSLLILECFHNSLNDLQFFNCTSLENIDCSINELSVLDVSSCESLIKLNCDHNQLTSILMEGCNNLTTLSCRYNSLTSLDISVLPALSTLSCSFNYFTLLTLPPNIPPLTSYTYAPQSNIPLVCKYDDVDLSEIYSIDGSMTTYIWRNRNTIVSPSESNEGRFVFSESYIDDSLTCLVRNLIFPLLWIQYNVKFTGYDDSGNSNPVMEGFTVYAGEQAINVTAAAPATIRIYSLQGALQAKKTVHAGHTRIPIERGIYVAVVNDAKCYKLIVR